MDKDLNKKKKRSYFATPWFLESLFFFLVLWQESFRLSSRTAHKILPIKSTLQKYYYYNFGDFVNGYIMAFIIDGVVNVILFKEGRSYRIFNFIVSKIFNSFLATICSCSIVVVFELIQSTSTTSDLNDIPAGILGAFLYFAIRLFALKINEKYLSQSK